MTPGAGSRGGGGGGGGAWTQLVLLDVHVTLTGSVTREGACVASLSTSACSSRLP